jgi:hypothetical protein
MLELFHIMQCGPGLWLKCLQGIEKEKRETIIIANN